MSENEENVAAAEEEGGEEEGEDEEESPASSIVCEHENNYTEPYMDALNDPVSEEVVEKEPSIHSLSSILQDLFEEATCEDTGTEMPWQKIGLPKRGTYVIAPIRPKAEEVEEGEGGGEEGEEEAPAEEQPPEPPPPPPGDAGEETQEEELGEDIAPTGFIYDTPTTKNYNEPYMDPLYRMFPDLDEIIECGAQTEMHWNDIVLPRNCKIAKRRKPCPEESSSRTKDGSIPVLDIEIDFTEAPTNSKAQVSAGCPAFLPNPKRCRKEFVLRSSDAPKSSSCSCQPPAVSGQSSVIIDIKPSSDCPYKSEYIPVEENSKYKADIAQGNKIVKTKSCSCTATSLSATDNSKQSSKSLPQISNVGNCVPNKSQAQNLKATVSLKKLGQPNKVVTKEIGIGQGISTLEMQVPDTPLNIKMQISAPGPPCATQEVCVPARCGCKDAIKPDTFKPDPVMVALDAYEAEMRPLRQALTQLQQKIRNLNLSEMKGCMCATALNTASSKSLGTVRSRVTIDSTIPGAVTKTKVKVHPNLQNLAPKTCNMYQPPTLQKPQNVPYYNFTPAPLPPPRMPEYMPPDSHNMYCYRPPSISSPKINNRCACGAGYASNDLTMQARKYGTSPDYRGRSYSNQESAYHNIPKTPQYQLQNVMSSKEFKNDSSEYVPCPSRSETKSDFTCPFMETVRSISNQAKTKKANCDCTPSANTSHVDNYRNGKSLKTDPNDFYSICPKQNSSQGEVSRKTVSSKTTVKVNNR